MSVLFVLVWSSRKWPRHFLSKHREMKAHFTETWDSPKPTTCTCEEMNVANNVKRGFAYISCETSFLLFNQAIFDFDAVEFFQHGFGGNENEDYCGGGMDQVHGKTGHIVSFQHFPVDGLGIVH